MKTTVKKLLKLGHIVNNVKTAKDCDMLAYYEPAKKTKIDYLNPDEGFFETLISIDLYEGGDLMAITVQGREHLGEFEIKSDTTVIEVNVYTKK